MIKWFCDVCLEEIKAPEHPVRIEASRCVKNRDDSKIGWGESDEIGRAFCHRKCADELETRVKAAFSLRGGASDA
jgi:hypothetical protein